MFKAPSLLALTALLPLAAPPAMAEAQDPILAAWLVNTQGIKASSTEPALDALAADILANVTRTHATDDRVYVETSGVPSYPTGPFLDGNPAYASNIHAVYQIPRKPHAAQNGHLSQAGLGPIGLLVNGVAIFSYSDARSYQNQGIWHQNANVFERHGFDNAPGHPSPLRNASPVQGYIPGLYHHHQSPQALREQLGDDGSHHSPILGFAFDGYPIYGPYGYANPDGSGGVTRLKPGYQLRTIADRSTLPDGKKLPTQKQGPTLADIPLGAYLEDFEFVANSGNLDEHNGRFTVTPDYPQGTYAYFTTVDDHGEGVFPYFIGLTYYGEAVPQVQGGQVPDSAKPQGGSAESGHPGDASQQPPQRPVPQIGIDNGRSPAQQPQNGNRQPPSIPGQSTQNSDRGGQVPVKPPRRPRPQEQGQSD